jgi:hypothetical protein
VGLGRFELPTSRLSGVRSNQLSYRPSGELNALSRAAIPWKLNRDVAPIDLGLGRIDDEITGPTTPL